MNVSRRVVAHMNGLQGDDYEHLKAEARNWLKILSTAEATGHIPPAA